jgi:hypothetical protein
LLSWHKQTDNACSPSFRICGSEFATAGITDHNVSWLPLQSSRLARRACASGHRQNQITATCAASRCPHPAWRCSTQSQFSGASRAGFSKAFEPRPATPANPRETLLVTHRLCVSASRQPRSIVALLDSFPVLFRVFADNSPIYCARSLVSANHFVRNAVSAVHVLGESRCEHGRRCPAEVARDWRVSDLKCSAEDR